MKKVVISLIWIITVQLCLGQKTNIIIDKNFFLIGTLSDYMGRQKYPERNAIVDEYYKCELSLALKIDSLLKVDYPDFKIVISDEDKQYIRYSLRIYSKQLSDKIDGYYSYKPSGTLTMDRDTMFYGDLKSDIFKTDQQRYSFLTGVYVRYGVENDSTFCIRINNSTSKARICAEMFKKMNCRNVVYEIRPTIPRGHMVYFTPTQELKEYLMKVMYLRHKLNDDWNSYFKGMIGEENYNK